MQRKLIDTPLHEFVCQQWPQFEHLMGSVGYEQEDVLLYLIWTLDGYKDNDDTFIDTPLPAITSIVREHFRRSGRSAGPEEILHMAQAVEAMALGCLSLLVPEGVLDPEQYQRYVYALGDDWTTVRENKVGIQRLGYDEKLSQWMKSYWLGSNYYTVRYNAEWDLTQSDAYKAEEATASQLDWMRKEWSLERKRSELAEIREEMRAASAGMDPNSKKKGRMMKDIFYPRRLRKDIHDMPTYEQAKILFGEFTCLPTKKPYYAAYEQIMGYPARGSEY